MEKRAGRELLKKMQAIVNLKNDEDADKVLEDLRNFVNATPPVGGVVEEDLSRKEKRGRDRMERGGQDRAEG